MQPDHFSSVDGFSHITGSKYFTIRGLDNLLTC
jgi:hypothetical protein